MASELLCKVGRGETGQASAAWRGTPDSTGRWGRAPADRRTLSPVHAPVAGDDDDDEDDDYDGDGDFDDDEEFEDDDEFEDDEDEFFEDDDEEGDDDEDEDDDDDDL